MLEQFERLQIEALGLVIAFAFGQHGGKSLGKLIEPIQMLRQKDLNFLLGAFLQQKGSQFKQEEQVIRCCPIFLRYAETVLIQQILNMQG